MGCQCDRGADHDFYLPTTATELNRSQAVIRNQWTIFVGGASDPSNPGNVVPPSGLPKVQAFAGYRACKTGLNMMMLNWARALKSDGVKVWSVAPGLLATSLGGDTEVLRKLGAKDPSIGGKVLRGVIEGRRDADVGKVVREYKTPVQPW